MPVRATTVAVNPDVVAVTLEATLMAGVTGAPTTVTLRDAAALVVAPLLSRHVRTSVPTAPAVYVTVFVDPLVTPAVPPALVMVPPVSVHWYVMPLRAVTLAVRPDAPVVTGLVAVIVGVVTLPATTVTLALAGALAIDAALISTAVSAIVPTGPAVYVIRFTPEVLTPAVPPELVMVPPARVHR